MRCVCLIAMMLGPSEVPAPVVADRPLVMAAHTYEARIRLDGRVSTTRVQASDAGQAKKLVRAQFGPQVTVLSVKRID
jgi:hypothetical protein